MDQENRYMSIPAVAEETGLSEAFWRKAIFHRRIAFVKMGKRVMIRRNDLDQWIAARIVQAASGRENR
jgi:excisionase family DNA binding protein